MVVQYVLSQPKNRVVSKLINILTYKNTMCMDISENKHFPCTTMKMRFPEIEKKKNVVKSSTMYQ